MCTRTREITGQSRHPQHPLPLPGHPRPPGWMRQPQHTFPCKKAAQDATRAGSGQGTRTAGRTPRAPCSPSFAPPVSSAGHSPPLRTVQALNAQEHVHVQSNPEDRSARAGNPETLQQWAPLQQYVGREKSCTLMVPGLTRPERQPVNAHPRSLDRITRADDSNGAGTRQRSPHQCSP